MLAGGHSLFVDYLLELGFSNITVLDISEAAIERAKKRLGEKANGVEWIISDYRFYTNTKFMTSGMIVLYFIS